MLLPISRLHQTPSQMKQREPRRARAVLYSGSASAGSACDASSGALKVFLRGRINRTASCSCTASASRRSGPVWFLYLPTQSSETDGTYGHDSSHRCCCWSSTSDTTHRPALSRQTKRIQKNMVNLILIRTARTYQRNTRPQTVWAVSFPSWTTQKQVVFFF
jgi:hypothetical protein